MREILFRGKTLISGRWIAGDLRQWSSGNVGICDRSTNWTYKVDPDTVGQYTGLKDKDGKPIFEGDVLRFYSDYTNEFMGNPCIARYGVFNCTCCEGVYGWYFEGGDIRDHNLHAVIGNMHDNPELMEARYE